MHLVMNIFEENKEIIENHLLELVERRYSSINVESSQSIAHTFETFSTLDNFYITDLDFNQTSSVFSKSGKIDNKHIGTNRSSYFKKCNITKQEDYISSPHICETNNSFTITIIKKDNDKYVVFNFCLYSILSYFSLLKEAKFFSGFSRFMYAAIGIGLIIFTIFLIGYAAIHTFLIFFTTTKDMMLQSVFQSIIALTLGLAIFDLAKTLIEQEVIFRTLAHNKKEKKLMFEKFLISIIIALSIEALMVVFKIAIENHQDMIYALYLIGGISLMIIALSLFYFASSNNSKICHKCSNWKKI